MKRVLLQTTLAAIKQAGACEDSYKHLLKALGGTKTAQPCGSSAASAAAPRAASAAAGLIPASHFPDTLRQADEIAELLAKARGEKA